MRITFRRLARARFASGRWRNEFIVEASYFCQIFMAAERRPVILTVVQTCRDSIPNKRTLSAQFGRTETITAWVPLVGIKPEIVDAHRLLRDFGREHLVVDNSAPFVPYNSRFRMRPYCLPLPPAESRPSAPRGRRLVDTGDVEEARATFSRVYSEARVEPVRGIPFGCTLDLVSCGSVKLATGTWPGGGHIAVPFLEDRYFLTLAINDELFGQAAETPFVIVPGQRGAVFSAGRGATFNGSAGHCGRSLIIERGVLEEHFRALTGRDLREPLCFEVSLALNEGPGAAVFEIATTLSRELERPGSSPLLIAALHDAFCTSLLTNVVHNASALLAPAPSRITPGSVRIATEYMNAHAAEPITLIDIAAAAGVSVRSLQAGFRTHRNLTPMEHLKERRIELARECLLRATPETTVVAVVRALGLGDPGRFSGEYRRRFGETPSETLARMRGP